MAKRKFYKTDSGLGKVFREWTIEHVAMQDEWLDHWRNARKIEIEGADDPTRAYVMLCIVEGRGNRRKWDQFLECSLYNQMVNLEAILNA